ncbi:unnamed protein product [Heterobilharzia americana]|nr:unnamed protein product [Heterobilharzia americana]
MVQMHFLGWIGRPADFDAQLFESEEVYAGLPTVFNSRNIAKQLDKCLKALQDDRNGSSQSVRTLLTRIELLGTLASCQTLFELESSIWKVMFTVSYNSGRYLDASFALINYAFSKLFSHEQNASDYETLKSVRNEVLAAVQDSERILESSQETCSTGRLTPHAQFQSVIISLGRAYIKHYCNWTGFSANLDLIRLQYEEFFSGKSWTVVCARGYFYWLHLHARCLFGGSYESCEYKLQNRCSARNLKNSADTEKENKDPTNGHRNSEPSVKILSPSSNVELATVAWSSASLTDTELLNLWLATRLLLYGVEARVYQNELLCISQRFHLCNYTQVALNLMAHLDMFAQRRWAFELRLLQLNHIATCHLSLEEIVGKRSNQKRQANPNMRSNYKSSTFPSESLDNSLGDHKLFKDVSELNSVSRDAFSDGSNMLLSDNCNEPFRSILHSSPTERLLVNKKVVVINVYPSATQIGSVIAGKLLTSDWNTWYDKGFYMPNSTDVFESVSHSFLSVGGVPLGTCVCSILNGTLWPWLFSLTQLVRKDLLPVPHYLPALNPISSKQASSSAKVCVHVKSEEDRDLIDAFASLNTSPKENAADACKSERGKVSPQLNSPNSLHTGKQLLPPTPKPNAPRRLADIHSKVASSTVCSNQSNGNRYRTSRRLQANRNSENFKVPLISSRRSVHRSPKEALHSKPLNMGTGNIPSDQDSNAELLQLLGLTPRKTANSQPSQFTSVNCSKKGKTLENGEINDRRLDDQPNGDLDPIESCSALIDAPLRPRSVRLASKWASAQKKRTFGITLFEKDAVLPETTDHMNSVSNNLAARLYEAYQQLSSFPVPNLLRPICQWLAIYWLGKNDHLQAGRFLCQAVGIGPTNLYLSILSSRITHLKSPDCQNLTSHSKKKLDWSRIFQCVKNMCAPNYFATNYNKTSASESCDFSDDNNMCKFLVVQLCLVDELGCRSPNLSDEASEINYNTLSPNGLGARTGGYLIVSRYIGVSGHPFQTCQVDSRIMHGFTLTGVKFMNSFNEIQLESIDSLVIEDRADYWRARYSLNNRIKNLIKEMRREWFTEDDLDWLFNRGKYFSSGEFKQDHNPLSVIIVPDRRLSYLPWEWILWNRKPNIYMPVMTRNFSLPLVVGVTGRVPTTDEVNNGFTNHDLVIYLGHGNGSSFLMHTFNQGLSARAVALVIGCSSGRPRWAGRHEPYTSLFNHVIAGCPFVCGLLWDVTDRDVDRFTLQFLINWLGKKIDHQDDGNSYETLGSAIFHATSACKLKHLIGKSVIVYGIPAEPNRKSLLKFPSSLNEK